MKDVFAVPGETQQVFCHARHAPSGAVLMQTERPSTDHTAQADGTWVLDAMLVWEKEIAESDIDMPRWAEDLWDAIGIENAPSYVQDKHANKKALRNAKPEGV